MKTQREVLEKIFYENICDTEMSEERIRLNRELTEAMEPLRENFTLYDAIENAASGLAFYAGRDGFLQGYQFALVMMTYGGAAQ